MSGLFEQELAKYTKQYLEANPPRGGQILLAEFHSGELADAYAAGLVDTLTDGSDSDVADPESDGPGALPTYETADGVPVDIIRVVPEIDDRSTAAPHQVTQGFATRMRNKISASVETDTPRSMIMVLETDTSLDTLEASEELFGDDAPINLESFRDSVLDPSTCDSPQGRALLRGLLTSLREEVGYTEDVEVLETLCEIRAKVDAEDASALQDLISELPQFIREDQALDEDWFDKQQDEETLQEMIEESLEDNREHAKQLQRAHRAGTDTESRLSSEYKQSFVNQVVDSHDWSEIGHSEARKGTKTGGVIRFNSLSVDATDHRLYEPIDADWTERSIIARTDDGEVRLSAEFVNDIKDTPREFRGPDGAEVGRVSKRNEIVTATIEDLPDDRPWFGELLFWVGKKTTRGKPTHVFKLAVVPDWFFTATQSVSLDVDVESEAFISNGDDKISLQALEDLRFDSEPREVDLREDKTITFDSPLTINPAPPDVVERVTCQIALPEGVPIQIDFLTEVSTADPEEVTFPLMLAAIVEPERWAAENLKLPDSMEIDTDRGEIYTAADNGIRLEDEALELIQIEEQIIDDRSLLPRLIEGDEVDFGDPTGDDSKFPDTLRQAYDDLFAHLEDRGRTPSTDPWDKPTKTRVEAVVNAYVEAVDAIDSQKVFGPYELLRDICTIKSETTEKVWLTPFHPLLLAYGLRIATWRDSELLPGGTNAGFRRDQFISKFNANGLHPYRTIDRSKESLLRGMPYADNPLWTVYSPIESPGSITPRYMERVVRDKLYTFVQAFPTLFELHPGRNIELNLINMGDLRPVVKGLYEFYKKIEKTDVHPPRILLRIYGDDSEGEALERFFTESAESRLRQNLEKKNDELVDRLRSHVTYVRAGEYSADNQHEAHLTFFRGLLEENPGVIDIGELPSGMFNGALFPRESIDVESTDEQTVYTVGFSCDDDEEGLIYDAARRTNALEAGKWNNSYHPHQTVKKNIESKQGTDLTGLWDDSLWVVHVQPNVGIDFYVRSDAELQSTDGRVMIHYSDQYDSSSPDYDVITSTNKRTPYLTALTRALDDANLGNLLDPETVLSLLVAIDGELALDLQQAEGTEVVETIGFVGGLALSQRLLDRSAPDHIWVPLSLNELSRHDRSYKGSDEGLLQYDGTGKASDDLCFVGIPRDPEGTALKLWLVETKGGGSQISSGREQIQGALDNLTDIFQPDDQHADDAILHGEFGKVVLDVARRMASYNVIDSETLETIESRRRLLLEGDFSVHFLEDSRGHIGEVIRVREDAPYSKIKSKDGVRSIETPIKALRLLDETDIGEVLPDLDLEELSFELEDVVSTGADRTDNPVTGTTGTASTTDAAETAAPTASTGDAKSEATTTDELAPDDGAEPATDDEETVDISETAPTESDDPSVTDDDADTAVTSSTPSDVVTDTDSAEMADADESAAADASFDWTTRTTANGGEAASGGNSPDTSGTETTPTADSSNDEQNGQEDSNAAEAAESAGDATSPESEADGIDERLATITQNLSKSPEPTTDINKGQLASNIHDGFESLGVDVHPPNPSSISIGPRKIGVDVLPKEGQKIEGVLNSLDSLSVHIQAHGSIVGKPNPSKGAVRLEIPHDNPQDIYLREGFEALGQELAEPLTIPLGVDTERQHHALTLPDERHALIAGATGSGKSNFLSAVICSLVATHTPDEVSLSLLDPKGVDFGRFASVPHVQTYEDTPNACAQRLLQLVNEQLPKRKEVLRSAGVPSVAELNENADMLDEDPLPYHVVVVDEYADLKMSVEDEDAFEDAVTRLAQVGRALGFIILLATQRPSADIVSGKIKANFPCRISFRLPSNTDSRVILDQPGAEDLEGAGDMITKTQAGDEYHLQGYRLTLPDASAIIDWAVDRDS
jgi:DNA phosphorothioation-dependent restriction protein DptH